MFDLVFVVFDIVVILVILIYCTFALGHYSIIYVSFSYERGSLLKSQWICFRFMLYFFSVRITEMLHSILLLFCYFQSHYMWFRYHSILFCFNLVCWIVNEFCFERSVILNFSVWEFRKYFTLHCCHFVFSIKLYAI